MNNEKNKQNRFRCALYVLLCVFCFLLGIVFATVENRSAAKNRGISAKAESVLYPDNLENFNQYLYRVGNEYLYRTPVYEILWNISISTYTRFGVSFLFVLDSSFNPVNKIYVQFSGGEGLAPFRALYGFSSAVDGISASDSDSYLVSGNSMSAYNVHFFTSDSLARVWDMSTILDCTLTVDNFALSTSVRLVNSSDSTDTIASVSFSSAIYQGRSTLFYTSFSSVATEIYKEYIISNAAWDQIHSSICIYGTSDHFILGGIYSQSQYDSYGNSQYNQGQQKGYEEGYSAGLNAGGQNSFLSLLTAVVDAPVTAFTSLFDFELLGYNMKTFVLSLLTLAFVVAIVRIFV